MKKDGANRKVWLHLLFLSIFCVCLLPIAQAQLKINNGGGSFTIGIEKYEYPYLVEDLSLIDTGENLIVTGTLKIEKNATKKEEAKIKIGYESIATKDAKLKLIGSKEDVLYDSSYVATGEEKDKTLTEYDFVKVNEIEGTRFTYTLPREEGIIHFGENSTILSINTWACGLNVTNDISSYEYGGGVVGMEFSDRGFILNFKDINGVEHGKDDAGCDTGHSTHCSIQTATSENTIPYYIGGGTATYLGATSPTKFYVNQSWTRGNSHGDDIVYFGYPFVISTRNSTSSTWFSSFRNWDSSGFEVSDACGDDIGGGFSCNIVNTTNNRRFVMTDYANSATDSYLVMADKSAINTTGEVVFSSFTGAYSGLMVGTDDTTAYAYLPQARLVVFLHGYIHIPITNQESYYGNLTYDHFLVYPNPTITSTHGDSLLFNNFKLIHTTDSNGDGKTILDLIPNTINNATWWYFDFPLYADNTVEIKIGTATCRYSYDDFNFTYTLINPSCPFTAIVEKGAGVGVMDYITGVAILNHKFAANSSITISINANYTTPIRPFVSSSTYCANENTLMKRIVTNITMNGNNTYSLSEEPVNCPYGCGEWLFGEDCLPSDFMLSIYAIIIVMVAGFIVFRFPRFVKKKKKRF